MSELYNEIIYNLLLYKLKIIKLSIQNNLNLVLSRQYATEFIQCKYICNNLIVSYNINNIYCNTCIIKINLLYLWKWNYRFVKNYNIQKSLHIFTYYLYTEMQIYGTILKYIILDISNYNLY